MKLHLHLFAVATPAVVAGSKSNADANDSWLYSLGLRHHLRATHHHHPSISTTNTQQQSLRKLLQLSDGADETNLGICEGDCDRDSDCRDEGAVCYQRYQTESVPGCDGVGVNKRDYCAFRPPNYLFWVSNGGSGYGLCEGDCDEDADCDQSGPPLKCFQRTGTTQVPGCDGVGRKSTDYCILDGTSQPTGNPTNVPTSSPSQQPTSLPTQIPTSSPTGVPTNTPSQFPTSQPTSPPTDNPTNFGSTNTPTNFPTKAPTGIPSTALTSNPTSQPTNAPTSNPTSQPTGVPTSNPTSVPTSAPSPTGATTCILVTTGNGQYDNGFLDLYVNSGTGYDEVTTDTEYVKGSEVLNQCYANFIGVRVTNRESNAWAGSIRFSLDNGVSYSAMSCQDCTGVDTTEYIVVDGDGNGTGDTKCFNGIQGNICTVIIPPPPQPTSPPTPSPTKTPTVPAPLTPQPTNQPNLGPLPLVFAGDNGAAEPGYSFPLDECQGDCDSDGECAGELKCYQRDNIEPIPGCAGDGLPGKDYCYLFVCDASNPPAYQYDLDGTTCDCGLCFGEPDGLPNVQGPEPLCDDSNVVVSFFALGDSPYDKNTNSCFNEQLNQFEASCSKNYGCSGGSGTQNETCIYDGEEYPCNHCTYIGNEYSCMENVIIPSMNGQIEAGAASFSAHMGDICGGGSLAGNKICNTYFFKGRELLFKQATNFLLCPGDNDWNECSDYKINQNTSPSRGEWRDKFTGDPFDSFTVPFPDGTFPQIFRKTGQYIDQATGDDNPEIFHFTYSKVAFFGLNRVSRSTYISDRAARDYNEDFIDEMLKRDTNCQLQSVVLFAQKYPKGRHYDKIYAHFNACNKPNPPILTVTGDTHPKKYCMQQDLRGLSGSAGNNEIHLTVEAFRSGPIQVFLIRDPNNPGNDYFHVKDTQTNNSNSNCPSYFGP